MLMIGQIDPPPPPSPHISSESLNRYGLEHAESSNLSPKSIFVIYVAPDTYYYMLLLHCTSAALTNSLELG